MNVTLAEVLQAISLAIRTGKSGEVRIGTPTTYVVAISVVPDTLGNIYLEIPTSSGTN